ncbi:MAG: HD family phosphohydrolase [Anaerolineales bacterium]
MTADSHSSSDASTSNRWRSVLVWGIGLLFTVGAATLLILPIGLTVDENVALEVGQVATIDVTAPTSITYISDIQTEQAREAAVAAVALVYDPPDTRIARQQVANARAALNFIGSVRADSFATPEQKIADLAQLTHVSLSDEQANEVLSLTAAQWDAVRGEVPRVIEVVMSDQVREDRVAAARERIPRLVSVALSVDEAAVVADLAGQFIVPNSLYNQPATDAAREAARDAVEPVSQSFVQGQTIISRGRVVTELDIEALEALNLLQPKQDSVLPYIPPALAAVLFLVTLVLYLNRYLPDYFSRPRFLVFLCVVVLAFLFGARLMIPDRTVMPFLFPAAALGMLVAVGQSPRLGLVVTVLFAVFLGVIADGRLDVVLYLTIGSLVAILALGTAERMNNYFRAGLAAAVAHAGIVLIFSLTDPDMDLVGLATLIGASVINGGLSASITLTIFFLLGSVFDITTALQLVELSRPNHPLLQELLRKAPGTYQHSLQVANLAEQAAEQIGANSLLVRVGALYHDVGKVQRPEYFVENQIVGENPHDLLQPHTSAGIIIDHVRDGDEIARRYRLPRPIRAAILEHQGTGITRYQYQKALDAAGGDNSQVDIADFTYPGPKPQSKETALLMIADGCESKSRADRPRNIEEITAIVDTIIGQRMDEGQLNECDLSLAEIQTARDSIINTLKGFFHARIKYPEAAPEESQLPEGFYELPDPDGASNQPVELLPMDAPAADS